MKVYLVKRFGWNYAMIISAWNTKEKAESEIEIQKKKEENRYESFEVFEIEVN